MSNTTKAFISLVGLILLGGCGVKTIAPKSAAAVCLTECSRPRLKVEVHSGTISGSSKDAAVDNRLKDYNCIECLKEACGD